MEIIVTPVYVGILVQDQILSGLRVYPNPSTGMFYIEYEGREVFIFSIIVTNISGSVVYTREFDTIDNLKSIDLQHLGRGTYFLRIADNETSGVIKIVIL